MFDLEQSILNWRQQMLSAGIQTPSTLEELDAHLREEVERQINRGLSAEEAFDLAAQKIGQANLLKMEFKKRAASVHGWQEIGLHRLIEFWDCCG